MKQNTLVLHASLRKTQVIPKPELLRAKSTYSIISKKHGNLHTTVQAEDWRQTQKNKFYSCGFCISLFETLTEYLNHIDRQHYRYHETLEHWDRNNVILGLLQQPLVQDVWRRIMAKYSCSPHLPLTWNKTAASSLQHRLERSEETPEALATAALMTSVHGSRQHELISPVIKHDGTAQGMDFGSESLALRPTHSQKALGDLTCDIPHQSRFYDLSEFGEEVTSVFCSELRGLQDGSGQDPWDPLRIHEGETLPIMNHDPHYATPGGIRQADSGRCIAGSNEIHDFADSQEAGVALGTAMLTDLPHSSFPLQTSSFPSSTFIASTPYPCDGLDRKTDDIVQTYERESPSQLSVFSMVEPRDRCSTEEEKKSIKLALPMQSCGVCRERSVQVSPPT